MKMCDVVTHLKQVGEVLVMSTTIYVFMQKVNTFFSLEKSAVPAAMYQDHEGVHHENMPI